MKKYKSIFLENLRNKTSAPFSHLTESREEKEYIRENGCTYKTKLVYGGKIAIIRDKKTKEIIELPIY